MIYGWRARIGLILPADNVVMEPELYDLGLDGVSFHTLRLTSTRHDEMRGQAVLLGETIRELGLDAVVYACAETSFNIGTGERRSLADTIREQAGLPFITATEALLTAIGRLGVRRLAVFTPYTARSGSDLESTLAGEGLEIVSATHRDFREGSGDEREWFATNREAAGDIYRQARAVDGPAAEALAIVSTNLNTLSIRSRLERDLGKPVLSSNHAILWWCLRSLGLQPDASIFGALGAETLDEA